MTGRVCTGSERPQGWPRGVALLLGLGALAVLLGPVSAAEEEGQTTLLELKAFASRLVQSGEVEIFPFHVSMKDGILTFDSGDVVACSQSTALCSTPLGVLVRAQCRVELLRGYVKKQVESGEEQIHEFWAPTIETSERVIAKALENVRQRRHTPGVLLRRAYMALWRVEEILLGKLWSWAEEAGCMLQTLEEGGGDVADPCAPPPTPFARLRLATKEGEVHYMTAIDWDLVALSREDPTKTMDIVDGEGIEIPEGLYMVKAVWPDGTTLGPNRIRIQGDQILARPPK